MNKPEPILPRSIRPVLYLGGALLALVLFALVVVGVPRARAVNTIGTATLKTADGASVGTVRFQQEPDALVTRVVLTLRLPRGFSGFHGFHLHANDSAANGVDCVADAKALSSTWFVSADGHYKRDVAEAHPQHAGDLPAVWVNQDGTGSAEFVIDRIQTGELFNRAVMLHAGADNFGNIPLGDALTQYKANGVEASVATRNTGNAGDRLACGLVEVSR